MKTNINKRNIPDSGNNHQTTGGNHSSADSGNRHQTINGGNNTADSTTPTESQSEQTVPHMSEKLLAFNRIYKEYNDIYHDAAMRLGLSNSEFDILYSICELGDGCKQRDICESSYIPKQTVNSAIRTLEKKGCLTLTPGKGRSMLIYLTETGMQLIRRTIFPMIEIENEAFPESSERTFKTILDFHIRYLKALRAGVQKL